MHLWFFTGKLRLMTVCTENRRKMLRTSPIQSKHTLSYHPLSIIDFRLSEEWLEACTHTQAYTYTQVKNIYISKEIREMSQQLKVHTTAYRGPTFGSQHPHWVTQSPMPEASEAPVPSSVISQHPHSHVHTHKEMHICGHNLK